MTLYQTLYLLYGKLVINNLKNWKNAHNITKNTIKNYYKNHQHHNANSQNAFTLQINSVFIFNDTLTQVNNKVAFIYATTSNFLHNGPWFNHNCNIDLAISFVFISSFIRQVFRYISFLLQRFLYI
jgi:hypothetical protein